MNIASEYGFCNMEIIIETLFRNLTDIYTLNKIFVNFVDLERDFNTLHSLTTQDQLLDNVILENVSNFRETI